MERPKEEQMRIGVIGSGNIGGTSARLFAGAGHEVMLANSRGPASLAERVTELGPNVRAGTVEEAARFGEVVLLAVPLRAYRDLPPEPFAGRIVVDANNYFPQRDDEIPELERGDATSSELLAERLADARVVKALNHLNYRVLAGEGRPGAPREERIALFVAGDDADAKCTVSDLLQDLGFGVVDVGGLEAGAGQQPGTPRFNLPMTVAEAEAARAG
jgi:predicted dinucleotide-binding enzyme